MQKDEQPTDPPKLVLALLRYFLKQDFLEEIEGDIKEVFQDNLQSHGIRKAKILFWKEAIRLLRPSLLKSFEGTQQLNQYGMIKNNFKVALRSLKKSSLFTTINTLGLSVGLASSIMLLQIVIDEFSYDKFFTNTHSIYKVGLERDLAGMRDIGRNIPHSFASAAIEDIPEIENAVALAGPFREMLITYEDQIGNTIKNYENVIAADSNFFAFFDFDLVKGNPKTALLEPKSMVLTESAANRYFEDIDPIGKFLNMAGDNFLITAICKDPPSNTHIQFNFLMSIHTIKRFNIENFSRPDVNCYYKIKKGASTKEIEQKLTGLISKYSDQSLSDAFTFFLVPLSSVYLHPDDLGGFTAGGNITTTWIIFGIAILILLLACINFINLLAAKSLERAREVGIRKVLGSRKRQLIFRFLTESVIICLLSAIIAIVFVLVTQDYFAMLTGKTFTLSLQMILYIFMAAITLGIVAGVYPALIISAHKPVSVLKGQLIHDHKGNWIKDGLVVFQFAISAGCLICMLVISDQVHFLLNKDIGYDKERLLVVSGDFHMQPQFCKTLIDEIKTIPEAQSVAGSLSVPGLGIFWEDHIQEPISSIKITTRSMVVGDEFCEVFGMRLKVGRLFSNQTDDSKSVVLNESAVKALNLKSPLGKAIMQDNGDGDPRKFEVIGVVNDFNFDYLYNAVSPLMIKSNEQLFNRSSRIVVRLRSNASRIDAITKIEAKWKLLKPEVPFTYSFINEIVDGYYKKETRLLAIFKVFSFLCLFIASIGLFGLSIFMTNIRTKEMGIRKVLGANMFQLIGLLYKPFTLFVALALLIAIPITWYGLESFWLNSFAYRIEINGWTIALVAVIVILITWSVVGYQILKKAALNPVDTLRDD